VNAAVKASQEVLENSPGDSSLGRLGQPRSEVEKKDQGLGK